MAYSRDPRTYGDEFHDIKHGLTQPGIDNVLQPLSLDFESERQASVFMHKYYAFVRAMGYASRDKKLPPEVQNDYEFWSLACREFEIKQLGPKLVWVRKSLKPEVQAIRDQIRKQLSIKHEASMPPPATQEPYGFNPDDLPREKDV